MHVSPEKEKLLNGEMAALGIRQQDIEEKFVRSSGRGGQKVNKTSTCVCLRHLPTGLEVKCMAERSQSVNRFLARRILLEKIKASRGMETASGKEAQRVRKQKARRKRRLKEKLTEVQGE